jgi:hypothetical protein
MQKCILTDEVLRTAKVMNSSSDKSEYIIMRQFSLTKTKLYGLSLSFCSINMALPSDLLLCDTPHCHEETIVYLADHVTSPQN